VLAPPHRTPRYRPAGWVPKISDFGLAKRLDRDDGGTRSGALVGTPAYMAPEQAEARNAEVGPAADIHALGLILYECLTGRNPFRADTLSETLLRVITAEPVPPRRLNDQVPRDLETICLKCLQKHPGKRFATAAELARELRRFRVGLPIHSRPVGPLERGWRWCRRKPAAAALLASLVLVAALSAVLAWGAVHSAAGEKDNAAKQSRLSELLKDALEEAERKGDLYLAELRHTRDLFDANEKQRLTAVEKTRKLEEREKDLARTQRDLDDTLRVVRARNDDLAKALRTMRRDLYFNRIHLAERELRDQRPTQAEQLLKSLRPEKDEEDLRRFEWYHLKDECRRPLREGGTFTIALCGPKHDWLAWINGQNQVVLRRRNSGAADVRLLRSPGHTIACLAASPDGKYLAVGCDDGYVCVWELDLDRPAARETVVFKDDGDRRLRGRVNVVGFGYPPPGAPGTPKRLGYAGADREVRFAELGADGMWRAAGTFPNFHDTEIRSLVFDPTGEFVATGSVDARQRYWDVKTGKDRFDQQFASITAWAFHPQGTYLALAKEGGTVVVYELNRKDREPKRVCDYREHGGADVLALCFSAGDRVASVSDDGLIRVWQVRKGETTEAVDVVALRGVGGFAFGLKKGEEIAWLGLDGVVRWRLNLPGSTTLTFDRKTGHNRRTDRDGDRVDESLEAYVEYTDSVAFAADGKSFATGSSIAVKGTEGAKVGGEVRVWDVATGRKVAEKTQLSGGVWTVAYGKTGALAWGEAGGGDIFLWARPGKGEPTRFAGHMDSTECLAFSPDATKLVSGGRDRAVKLWDVETGKPLWERADVHEAVVLAAAFAPDGSFVTADKDGRLVRWGADGRPGPVVPAHTGAINGAAFSPDGKLLATTGDDGRVKLWLTADLGKEKVEPVWMAEGHASGALGVCFSPKGERLATTGRDKAVRLWETATGREALALQGRSALRYGVAFHPGGRRLVAASAEGVKVWDADAGR
jgi:WD40 repeat protein